MKDKIEKEIERILEKMKQVSSPVELQQYAGTVESLIMSYVRLTK